MTQHIIDHGDLRKYRIELPNLYDDAELDVYEFRLLVHYKRVGTCWESVRTTAEKCRMSVGKVSQARRSLAKKGWIVVEEKADGGFIIHVQDVWERNFAHFTRRSSGEQGCSCGEQGCSCGEPKNKPIKKEPIKNNSVYTRAREADGTPSESPSASGNPPVYFSRSVRRSWASPLPPIEQETISADIVALADYFADRIGRKTPDLRFKHDQWRDPLERILEMGDSVAGGKSLIDQAVTYMDQTNLSIGTPKSIVNVAASLHRRSNLPQQQAAAAPTAADSYREVFK